jgi:hypothetical protein
MIMAIKGHYNKRYRVRVCVTSYIVNSKNYHVRSDRKDVQDKDAHLYKADNIACHLFS